MAVTDCEPVRVELGPDYGLAHPGASRYTASHPRPVREAIDLHRRTPDANPVGYAEANELKTVAAARETAAGYAGCPRIINTPAGVDRGLAAVHAPA